MRGATAAAGPMVGWLEMEDQELLLWSFPGYLQMVGIGHRHRCGPAAGRGSWSPVEDRERENGRRGEQGWSSDARGKVRSCCVEMRRVLSTGEPGPLLVLLPKPTFT